MSKSSIGWRKAGISSLATAALVAGACVAGAGAASATTGFNFNRVNGTDRYGTSAAVAKEFGSATDVILASGLAGHYPDALAANYLAGTKDAPVLLTKKDSTPPAVLQAIKDTGADTIWIVGGTGVISQAQEDALVSDGYNVHRISGVNRYETATQVIEQGGTSATEGIVATGENFPDALGAGPLSYAKGMPLAITQRYSMNQDEIDALKAAGVKKVLIVGGTKAVSNSVATQLEANNIQVDQRLSGTNRSATAEAVANYELKNGFTNTAVNVASGFEQGDGADALGGGALSGANNTPMLITMSDVTPGAATLDYLTSNANTLAKGDLFGGTAAISDDAAKQMETAAQAVKNNQSYTVAPQDAVTQTLSTTDGSTDADSSDDRTFTATGLDTGTYTVSLFPASDVTVGPDGKVHFTDNPANGKADGEGDTSVAKIVSENNITIPNGTGSTSITPVNGTVTFKIDGVGTGSVVPVLYKDSDNNQALSVDSNGLPTDPFGVGGETTYVPAGAAQGTNMSGTVDTVNKAAHEFTADGTDPNTSATIPESSFNYDSNDAYYVSEDGGTTYNQATMADFEAALSRNDGIDVYDYQPNSALVSTFYLNDSSPANPGTPTASKTTNSSTVLTFNNVDANASQVTVYGTSGSSAADPTTKDKVYATSTKDADANTAGWQVDISGLAAATQYKFAGTQTVDGDESPISSPVAVTTKSAAAQAPTITDAKITTDQVVVGQADKGDVWNATFSEPVTSTDANGNPSTTDPSTAPAAGTAQDPVFDMVDANGDTIRVECLLGGASTMPNPVPAGMTYATCTFPNDSAGAPTYAGTNLTITLLNNAQDRNAAGGATYPSTIEYPLTVTSVSNVVDLNDDLPIDLANSKDKVVDGQ